MNSGKIFEMLCKRRHFFRDKEYTLVLYEDNLTIGENGEQKYCATLQFQTVVHWKTEELHKQIRLLAIGMSSEKKVKWFYAKHEDLIDLKNMLGQKVFYSNITVFYESGKTLGQGASSQVFIFQHKKGLFGKLSDRPKIIICCEMRAQEVYQQKYCKLGAQLRSLGRKLLKKYVIQQRLYEEIRIMKILNHPNVINLKEIYEGENSFYLIIELLNGPTLSRFIQEQQNLIDEKIIKSIMRQLLSGLSYLHSKKIVHRDIKPENLLFSKNDSFEGLKIIDFGLSTFATKKLVGICGTPGYVAPEIFSFDIQNEGYSMEVDLFSAGVVFYKLLTKHDLFTGDITNEVLINNKECEVDYDQLKLLPYSKNALHLLQKMLAPEPWHRINAQQRVPNQSFLFKRQVQRKDNLLQSNPKVFVNSDNLQIGQIQRSDSIPQDFDLNLKVPVFETDKDFMVQIDQECLEEIDELYEEEDQGKKRCRIYYGQKVRERDSNYMPSFGKNSFQSFNSHEHIDSPKEEQMVQFDSK